MLQIRSILDVADNTGAKRAAAIGVLGRNQRYARVGDGAAGGVVRRLLRHGVSRGKMRA